MFSKAGGVRALFELLKNVEVWIGPMLSRLDELLFRLLEDSSSPEMLDDVECDHLLIFWPLVSAALLGRLVRDPLFGLTGLDVTMAVN